MSHDDLYAERHEDMSPHGKLRVIWQPDGDLIIECVEDNGFRAAVEFCNSGGQSPRTLRALRILILAMQADDIFNDYVDKDGIEQVLLEVGTKLQEQVKARRKALAQKEAQGR